MRSDRVGARRQADVVICGGGLAGLTLARQLRLEVPAAAVLVLERTTRPLPDACHKVGESTIELGAHYLAHTLGLEAYLRREHILKNGLRFFGGDTAGTFGERPEIGPSEPPVIPAFQLDRGKLERDLRAMVEAEGVTLVEGAMVEAVALDEGSSGSPAPAPPEAARAPPPCEQPTVRGVVSGRRARGARGPRCTLRSRMARA